MKIINKEELRQLVIDGISSEELNSKYDYSNIKNMSLLFFHCSGLESIPTLNTENVTSMSGMFYKCSELESITKLNTENVTSMSYMFSGCSELESIPKLNTENVTDMTCMFYGCSELRDLNIKDFLDYDFSELDNPYLRKKYPEYFI